MNIWLLLSALVYLRRCLSTSTREQGSSKTHIFYAVEIDGDSNTASFLAKQHGMQFISKVKWVNIRQLIIETCMLHSQSRMTEQVMVDRNHGCERRHEPGCCERSDASLGQRGRVSSWECFSLGQEAGGAKPWEHAATLHIPSADL
ncbi:uncharacterized protein LOC113458862 isoform X2 [Zonotrichia albicollis]